MSFRSRPYGHGFCFIERVTSAVRSVVWVVVVTIGMVIVAKAASALFVLFAGVLGAVFLETCGRFVSR